MESTLNNGHTIKVTPEIFEQAAKDFSEGNEALRKLLMYCFENNIETVGCCSGHDGERRPYVSFNFNDKNMQAIIKMFSNVSINDVIKNISIRKQPGLMANFNISMKDKASSQEATKGFEEILGALQNEKELNIEDIEENKALILKSAQNHDIPMSYFEVQEQEDKIAIMVGGAYFDALDIVSSEVAAMRGESPAILKLWIDDSFMIEYDYDSSSLNKTLRNLEPMTKSVSEKIYEKYYEKGKDDQEPSLGEVADELIELNNAGKQCTRNYKGFEIDNSKYENSKDIIKAYEADIYQKRIDEEFEKRKETIEKRKAEIDKNERMASAGKVAGNIEVKKKKDLDAIEDFLRERETKMVFHMDPESTLYRRREKKEDIDVLEPNPGARIEDVAQKMLVIKGYGQENVLRFNNFEIDTRNFESAEDIINAYYKDCEEKRNTPKVGGFNPEDIKETIDDVKISEINATAAEMKRLEIDLQPKKEENTKISQREATEELEK